MHTFIFSFELKPCDRIVCIKLERGYDRQAGRMRVRVFCARVRAMVNYWMIAMCDARQGANSEQCE